MKTLLPILAVMAVYYAVYEGIVAPSLRLALRNRLFRLRDELRRLKVQGRVAAEDEQAFWYVHDGINAFINRLPYLTLGMQVAAHAAYKADAALRAQVDARRQLLGACRNRAIAHIYARSTRVVEEAFVVNMGGWFVFILPGVLLIAALSWLKRMAARLLLTPEAATRQLIAQGPAPAGGARAF